MPDNCLIVVDMQNDFLDRLEDDRRLRLVANTNELIEVFRKAEYPIIWVRTSYQADLSDALLVMRDRQISTVIEGTNGAEIDPTLARRETDLVILKKRYSAFFGTGLEGILQDLAPERITLAGVNSHACIRMTAIDAYQRDMRLVLASDCIDSYDPEHARVSMAYMENGIAVAMTNKGISIL